MRDCKCFKGFELWPSLRSWDEMKTFVLGLRWGELTDITVSKSSWVCIASTSRGLQAVDSLIFLCERAHAGHCHWLADVCVSSCQILLPYCLLPWRPSWPHSWHSLAMYGRWASAGRQEGIINPSLSSLLYAITTLPTDHLNMSFCKHSSQKRVIADIYACYLKRASFIYL